MTDLTPMTAFGVAEARVETLGGLTLTERLDVGLASVALRKGADAPSGLPLAEPGTWAEGEGLTAFWMAPGQWMVEAPGRAEDDIAAEVAALAPDCSVTEQTDGWVVIDIDGPEIGSLLERLVNLPTEALVPGKATRTMMHHMSVFVIRRSETKLTVMGMRSMAGSLWHTLAQAAERRA